MACKWRSICPLREWEKKGLIGERWRKEYCDTRDNWKNCKRYKLEERGIPHENLLPDGGKR